MEQRRKAGASRSLRVNTVDTIKGIAIILVVYGHTLQGGMHRHLWDAQPGLADALNFSDDFIYTFHMAAFFFVAGLFLAGSAERRGPRAFILTKIRTILYPYLFWGVGAALIQPFISMFQVLSRPSSWHDVVYGLLTGDSSWFLITLFLCQMLALAVLMLRLPIWLQMLVSIAAALLVPPSAITVFYRPFVDLPFVVAGMWFSDKRIAALEKSKVRFVWVAFAVLLAIQLAAVKAWGEANRWDELPLGILGTAMLVFLSLGIHHSMLEKILGWYGEASLGIFVLAPYWQGLGREFVTRILHTTNPLPYLLLTTIVAATAPALIWSMKERWHIGWLFQWPEPKPAMKMEGQPGVI